MKKNLLNPAATAALTLTALAAITTNAPAQAIFDNTADGLYNYFGISSPGGYGEHYAGQSFTTGPDAALLTAISPYFGNYSGSDSFQLALYSSLAGAPGTQIAVFSGPTVPTVDALTTYTAPGSGVSLAASTTYWFVASSTGGNGVYNLGCTQSASYTTTDGWNINGGLEQNSGSGWSAVSGQQVLFSADATFTPTPEPGSLALIALGAGTGAVFFRRRQKN